MGTPVHAEERVARSPVLQSCAGRGCALARSPHLSPVHALRLAAASLASGTHCGGGSTAVARLLAPPTNDGGETAHSPPRERSGGVASLRGNPFPPWRLDKLVHKKKR